MIALSGLFQKECATSGLNFLAGFGALVVSGTALDRLGRTKTLLVSAVLLIIGSGTVASSFSFAQVLIGRALQGLGAGCTIVAASVYITEIAPARYRGVLVSIADISINFGILLGYGLDYVVKMNTASPETHWRVSMALSAITPILYCMAFPFLPESPRYLVLKGRESEAYDVIKSMWCLGDPTRPEQTLHAIKQSLASRPTASWSECLCQ